MSEMLKSTLTRFVKGFVAGAVASAVTFLASGVSVKSLLEFKALVFPFVIAVVTGGLLAAEKALSWSQAPPI